MNHPAHLEQHYCVASCSRDPIWAFPDDCCSRVSEECAECQVARHLVQEIMVPNFEEMMLDCRQMMPELLNWPLMKVKMPWRGSGSMQLCGKVFEEIFFFTFQDCFFKFFLLHGPPVAAGVNSKFSMALLPIVSPWRCSYQHSRYFSFSKNFFHRGYKNLWGGGSNTNEVVRCESPRQEHKVATMESWKLDWEEDGRCIILLTSFSKY